MLNISLFMSSFLLMYQVECAKILGIYFYPGRSHYIEGVAVMKTLAERGHEVTMVSAIGEKNPLKNYNDVVLNEVREKGEEILKDVFDFNIHPYLQTYEYNKIFLPLLNMTLSDPKFRHVLKTQTFDLVILEKFYNDGLLYIPYHLNVPFILHSTLQASDWTNPHVANPTPLSYVPHIFLPYTSHMTFFQRLDNTLMYIFSTLFQNLIVLPHHNAIVKSNFPEAPDISEYYNKPSIILLNEDSSINEAAPKVPSMIDIGGIHIKKPEPLPEDIELIMNNAKNGVIYFSMGSILKGKNIPRNIMNAFIKTFSKLNQTILWKFEDENLHGKPENVVIRKWLPQNDILAHPNLKLFITHGGIHSIQEAIYHEVPCLIIPIFGDQNSNAKRATKFGFAQNMHFEDISERKLLSMIEELLQNTRYADAVKIRSSIMKDEPITPAEKLIFWVEYVLRHKEVEHLKVAALDLSWFQYILLDVIFFLVFFTILCILFILIICKYLLSLGIFITSRIKIKNKLD